LPLNSNEAEATVVDDTIVLEDGESDYLITTEICEGTIRNSFIIENANVEECFPVKFDLPAGSYIEFKRDEFNDNRTDGSLQIVNNKNIENVQYPIVADPTVTFKSLFSSGKWINRSGLISLSLTPNATLRVSMFTTLSLSMRNLNLIWSHQERM